MNFKEFKSFKEEFHKASVTKKIKMYIASDDLEEEQYKILLQDFPINQLAKLEKALNEEADRIDRASEENNDTEL